MYAHDKNAFDDDGAHFGELLAKPAAVAVHNAWVLAEALALTDHLKAALAHLIVPYGIGDCAIGFATVQMAELLAALRS